LLLLYNLFHIIIHKILTKIKIGIVLLLLKKNRFENRRLSCAIKITNTFFSFFSIHVVLTPGENF